MTHEVINNIQNAVVVYTALWAFINLAIYFTLMFGSVFRAAFKLVRYADEGMEDLPPPKKLLNGYKGTEYEDEYWLYKSILDIWDYRRPATLLKLLINAPVLYYELLAGKHDVISFLEFGGYFSHDMNGFYKTLCYGSYLMYRETRIPKWIKRDKNRIGETTYLELTLVCAVLWFLIPIRNAYNSYAVRMIKHTAFAREVHEARQVQQLESKIEKLTKMADTIAESLNNLIDQLINNSEQLQNRDDSD